MSAASFRQRPARLVLYSFSIARHLRFGEVLRDHRRAARLTLEQLAEVSGVSTRTLSDMERGRSKGPQHRTVTALADALALQGTPASSLSSWRVTAGCGITGRAQPAYANCPGWLTTSPAVPRNWSG
jgi:DNA-binding XRE family transcriptional regulator